MNPVVSNVEKNEEQPVQVDPVKELYDFIERLEALTKDPATAARIRAFLKEKKIWD